MKALHTTPTSRAGAPPTAMPLPPELEEGVFRTCTLKRYRNRDVPSLEIDGEFIAYASPDSTFAVTKRLLDAARTSILIGIYDFNTDYMRDILLAAMRRGVKVALMLDIDSPEEQTMFDALKNAGAKTVEAPSCASSHVHYFRSSHEKVVVIDGSWTLVQSGNYTKASIPENKTDGVGGASFLTGNRDMGVAVHSKPLAAFFTTVLEADITLELDAEASERPELAPARLSSVVLAEKASAPPVKLFPSLRFQPERAIHVQPVLTPDNYIADVGKWLAGAKHSIWIENQYIKTDHSEIVKLLGKITAARKKNPKLDVRILLAKGFDGGMAVGQTFAALTKQHKLKLGTNLRILNPKHFDHLHNKLILIDGTSVLVSSQNWSNSAVAENREAGLLLEAPKLAQYYGALFQSDWDDALTKVPVSRPPRRGREAAGVRLAPADRGDYAEV